MAVFRFVVSANNAEEIAEFTVTIDANEVDAPTDMDWIWLARRVASLLRTTVCDAMDASVETTALLMETDADDNATLRLEVSVLRTVDMLEFVEVSVETDALIELESDEIEVLRVPTSDASAMENCAVVC